MRLEPVWFAPLTSGVEAAAHTPEVNLGVFWSVNHLLIPSCSAAELTLRPVLASFPPGWNIVAVEDEIVAFDSGERTATRPESGPPWSRILLTAVE
jgi:hypothetical protein